MRVRQLLRPRHWSSRCVGIGVALTLTACGHNTPTYPTIALPPPPAQFLVSGVVREPAPTAEVLVSAARLEIVEGSLHGKVFETDALGRFALPPVTKGNFELVFTKTEYEELRVAFKELLRDEALDVAMIPKRLITQQWNGTIDRDPDPHVAGGRLSGWPGDHVFETHRTDQTTLSLEAGCWVGGTYTDFAFGVVSVPAADPLLAVYAKGHPDPSGPPYRYVLARSLRPGQYRLLADLNGYLGPVCAWSLTLSRPY